MFMGRCTLKEIFPTEGTKKLFATRDIDIIESIRTRSGLLFYI